MALPPGCTPTLWAGRAGLQGDWVGYWCHRVSPARGPSAKRSFLESWAAGQRQQSEQGRRLPRPARILSMLTSRAPCREVYLNRTRPGGPPGHERIIGLDPQKPQARRGTCGKERGHAWLARRPMGGRAQDCQPAQRVGHGARSLRVWLPLRPPTPPPTPLPSPPTHPRTQPGSPTACLQGFYPVKPESTFLPGDRITMACDFDSTGMVRPLPALPCAAHCPSAPTRSDKAWRAARPVLRPWACMHGCEQRSDGAGANRVAACTHGWHGSRRAAPPCFSATDRPSVLPPQGHAVHAGHTSSDEMCNLYLMLYSHLPFFMWCFDGHPAAEVRRRPARRGTPPPPCCLHALLREAAKRSEASVAPVAS